MVKTSVRIRYAAALLVWALLLVPFFLGASAAHPATDDFTFAVYTHPTWLQTGSILHVLKDAFSYALRTWRDWQGTVTGVIIMALNPAVFSIPHYGVHAAVLLLLDLAAWFVFLRHMLSVRLRLSGHIWLPMYLLLSAMQLVFMPDMVEGIYWFNGAWFYTGAQAVALLTLVLCDRFSAGRAGRTRQILMCALCALLLFALGMDNYITAMMTAAALLMMALQRIWAGQRSAAVRTALLLIPIGAGLLLSIVAPGNAVRMETDGAHQSGIGWLMLTVGWTLRDALGYFVRFALKTPLLTALCAATPAVARRIDACAAESERRCPPVWATLLGAYLILCAMIIPHMYTSGYAGSGRVVNMYHDYVLIAVPVAWAMILARMKPARRAKLSDKRAGRVCAALCLVALCMCALGGQVDNYVKLVSDQADGTQDAYIAQFRNEYALCEGAGPQDDVLLPAWTVQTVTGKPTAYEDAAVWTNESMAQYFGVKSVRVAGEEQAAQ